MENKNKRLNTELVLNAYRAGLFPMAENSNTSEIFWVDPEVRGIIPLNKFHISRSLKKLLRKKLTNGEDLKLGKKVLDIKSQLKIILKSLQ